MLLVADAAGGLLAGVVLESMALLKPARSNRSLLVTGNSAGKGFGEARDLGGIFADSSRLRATETALSRVCGCKAAER